MTKKKPKRPKPKRPGYQEPAGRFRMASNAKDYTDVKLRGEVGQLLQRMLSGDCQQEILVEGAAGTGKSFGWLCMICYLCEMYPKMRVLLARKTLKSMRQSILVTLEDKVLPERHHALQKNNRTAQEPSYQWPNKSEIVCFGFDDVEKVKSSDYDLIAVNEGTEISLNDWEVALSRLRNDMCPLGHFALIDTNPDAPQHWLNKRADKFDAEGNKQMMRVKTWHEDNPALYNLQEGEWTELGTGYMRTLDALTGVRYQRLRLGNWVAAEGAIWPNYSEHDHVIDGELVQDAKSKRWSIKKLDGTEIDLVCFSAGVDWGFRAPGTLLVFGIDKDNNAYLVYEVYRAEMDKVWWAEKAEELRAKFDIERFICDSAEPDSIALFNKRMCETDGAKIAYAVEKHKIGYEPSFSVVREMWDKKRLFILRDSLESECPLMKDQKRPTSIKQEIPSYCYKPYDEGKPVPEEPVKVDDHGCDGLRYWAWFFDHNDWRPEELQDSFAPFTFGALLDHDDIMAKYCGHVPMD